MPRYRLSVALAALLCCASTAFAQSSDLDRDGLDDGVEDALLEQFRPSFMVSAKDCDQLPAEFAAGEATPRVVAKNGTNYGQATPNAAGGVELHYFHLWSRDCGRRGHFGDVEHVSALVRPADDGSWTARYWYAAAHEGTVCDRCMVARAEHVEAERAGPVVWVSAGKHASYFSQKACNGGCGGDTCAEMHLVPRLPLVNLGEPGAPLNGAVWTSAPAWNLAAKMAPDFDGDLLAKLEAAPLTGPVRVSSQTKGMQRTISVSNTTLGGLETAQDHTGSALGTANKKTGNALQRSYRAVKGWLRGK